MDLIQLEQLADALLEKIRAKDGASYSVAALALRLKSDADEMNEAIRLIEEWGYRLKRDGDFVTLVSTPDTLSATEIRHNLATKFIGQAVHSYQSVKSTNDIADSLACSGAPEGTIVTAERQTAGRGRRGRSWHSPEGTGIYLSIILRPKFKPEKAPGVSIMTALALADTISEYCPNKTAIKWPNDILIDGRKVAGILTELYAEKNRVEYIVIGIGININTRPEDFPEDIKKIATSIRASRRKKISRVALLQKFLIAFEKEYLAYQQDQLARSHKRVRGYSSLIGHQVKLASGKGIIEGTALDIDADGALLVDVNGERRTITSGEVTVVKE